MERTPAGAVRSAPQRHGIVEDNFEPSIVFDLRARDAMICSVAA
jgi:hypothetical protein